MHRLALRILYVAIFLFGVFLTTSVADAATIHSYKDTISDSAPATTSNHTIEFTTTVAIPPSGYVRFIPDPDDFIITASTTIFDTDNVELYVDTGSGFSLRNASDTVSSTTDGIVITRGTSGQIEVTLNTSTGIPADAILRLLIGNQTSAATSTDIGVINPAVIGTYNYTLETGGGGDSESVIGYVAIVDRVGVGPVDTTETIPPVRFNGAPSGTISGTTVTVQMSVETDEFAKCRYSTASNTPYFSMSYEMTTGYVTVHPALIAVATNTSYTFYIRCVDDEGNVNIDDYVISWFVPEYPEGVPGQEGEEEGEGSGSGEGDGESDSGGGDPSGDDDTSGGTSGGGGGGGGGGGSGVSSGGDDGSGGFETTDRPYQSGDARVIITGYAFPNSDVILLVDGAKAKEVLTNSNGSFSGTIDEIARGVYTFGVYAIDRNGTKSSTFSTTFTVTGGRGSTLSNVNIMPSILVSPDPVDPDSTVTFSGYSIPDATITIENQSDRSSVGLKTFTTTSDSRGAWSYEASTAGFTKGTYKVRAKAKQDSGISTDYSDFTYYGVGEEADRPQTSDLNQDGFVNLIDFSILLYWWNSDGGASDPPADINQDGRVSLTDFSIMIFNWTG